MTPASHLPSRRGIALIVTLWVSVILLVMLLGFSAVVRTEVVLSGNHHHDACALALAKAGIKRMLIQLENPEVAYVSEQDDWTYADSATDEIEFATGTYRVRVWDESGKLNLNFATEDMLTQLLGDPALADPILDWRDADADVRENGAEDEYYLSLQPPYYCKNGPFETPSELLLVKGLSPELFYAQTGGSVREQVLPPEERPEEASPEQVLPLSQLLTLYSFDVNLDAQDQPRVNLQTASAQELQDRLGDVLTEEEIRAIRRYRGDKLPNDEGGGPPSPNTGPSPATPRPTGPPAPSTRQRPPAAGPAAPDLANRPPGSTPAQQTPQQSPQQSAQQSPQQQQPKRFQKLGELLSVPGLTREKVEQILDRVTVTEDEVLPGRVNVNTAPREVLLALPLMTEEAAQAILSHRQSVGAFTELGEVLQVEELTDTLLTELLDHLTVRSQAFRLVAEGIAANDTVRRRIECIVVVEQEQPTSGTSPAESEPGTAPPEASAGSPPPAPSRQAPASPPSPGAAPAEPSPEETPGDVAPEPPVRTARIVYWRQ